MPIKNKTIIDKYPSIEYLTDVSAKIDGKKSIKGKTEYVPVAQEERKGWLQDRNNQRSDFIEKITATSDGFKIDKYKPLGITNKELNKGIEEIKTTYKKKLIFCMKGSIVLKCLHQPGE